MVDIPWGDGRWTNAPADVVERDGDLLVMAVEGQELQLVRVIPFATDLVAEAGPLVCAPTRAGLQVPLHRWTRTTPDDGLHP